MTRNRQTLKKRWLSLLPAAESHALGQMQQIFGPGVHQVARMMRVHADSRIS